MHVQKPINTFQHKQYKLSPVLIVICCGQLYCIKVRKFKTRQKSTKKKPYIIGGCATCCRWEIKLPLQYFAFSKDKRSGMDSSARCGIRKFMELIRLYFFPFPGSCLAYSLQSCKIDSAFSFAGLQNNHGKLCGVQQTRDRPLRAHR